MTYLKTYLSFCICIIARAWRVSPPKNLAVLAAVLISAVSLILCPLLLGYGVGRILENPEHWRHNLVILIAAYSALWFLGQTFRYFFYTFYGFIEQKMQSRQMADALAASVGADPRARIGLGSSEIAYAVDAQAASSRETLASLYLSILPAAVGVLAGAVSIWAVAGTAQLAIFCGFTVLYVVGSLPLIARHQKYQGKFFEGSLKSFGVLENSLQLWREGRIFAVAEFLRQRYAQGRLPVEAKALTSYRYTVLLHLWQGTMLALCLLTIVLMTVGKGQPAQVVGAVVSLIGVCAAAMMPLQSVGFGVSTIAVSAARYRSAEEKINAAPAQEAGHLVDYLVTGEKPSLRFKASEITGEDGAEYTLTSGRPCWVRGASGAGKTLFLERLLRLRALKNPASVRIGAPHGHVRFVYLPQEADVMVGTARENVAFGLGLPEHLSDKYLRAVGLGEFASGGARASDTVAGDGGVSGGEGRRIGLARTLAAAEFFGEGEGASLVVVVLDEPTAGLDAPTRARAWALIERAARDAIVLVSTHDEDAPVHGDDTVIMLKRHR